MNIYIYIVKKSPGNSKTIGNQNNVPYEDLQRTQ